MTWLLAFCTGEIMSYLSEAFGVMKVEPEAAPPTAVLQSGEPSSGSSPRTAGSGPFHSSGPSYEPGGKQSPIHCGLHCFM